MPESPRWMPLFTIAIVAALSPSESESADDVRRPDVLMIVVDDMNDWITLLDDEAPIQTPNLKRLAARGMLFTRAYCASPACNPSRVSALTGLRPTTSGVYGNKSDWRKALPDRETIMQRFRDADYEVCGAGKIFHHHLDGAFHDEASFDDFQPMRPQLYPPKKLNNAPEYGSANTDWGEWPPAEEDSIDVATADYAVRKLLEPPDRPLFLACGIFKPHSPFFSPSRYHAAYRAIEVPPRAGDDWSDLPSGAGALMKRTRWFWNGMMSLDERLPGSYQSFVSCYAAAASFADAQIGRVLDALESSPRAERTIVILWSDHGFHLGEKNHIEKFSLWEKANHIPFIVSAPGVAEPGSRCDRPVDLTVLYPTLLELAGLPGDQECDGQSLVPLLRDATSTWDLPALMTYQKGNHAIRTERWRYIRYADGSEELYDHDRDSRELTNLAGQQEMQSVKAELARWLPAIEAKPVSDLKRPRQ